MRIKISYCGLMLIICFLHFKSNCQIKPETNTDCNNIDLNKNNGKQSDGLKKSELVTILCDSNFFWGLSSDGLLVQFHINGTTIISDGIIDYNPPALDLAICNNLNGGTISPTFYLADMNGSVFYYEGISNWIAIPQTPPQGISNAGGNGFSLYFQYYGFNSLPSQIIKYDGTSFYTFYSDDSLVFSVGDLAVDDYGNVWSFEGHQAEHSQFINCISPSGQLIKQYNFVFNTYNAYGCFLLHNNLYVGLGPENPVYPNSLLPISFSVDSAYIGSPLMMPMASLHDLASCSNESPLQIRGNLQVPILDILCYPNPTDNQLNIEINSQLFSSDNYLLSIYNIQGLLVFNQPFIQKKTTFDLHQLVNGIYIIKIKSKDWLCVKQIVKE
jgi:hypothetical protein